MNYITAAVTDVGTVKTTNQDSLLIKSANTKIGKIVLSIVCDGMGGLSSGEIASATVINTFNNWFMNELPNLIDDNFSPDIVENSWTKIIKEQNRIIMNYGNNKAISLGTTVCGILITEKWYCVVNVGDSRCYMLNDSFTQITKDQTLVQREYEAGRITLNDIKTDPRRSVLLQCVGCNNEVTPVYCSGKTEILSSFVLCSDGFRHKIDESEIYNALNPNVINEKQDAVNNITYLINENKNRGETDNITALFVQIV